MGADFKGWIRGVGMTQFAKRSELTFAEMGQHAIDAALSTAAMTMLDIDEFICGTGYGGPLAGQRIVGPMGFSGNRVVNVENACSSGLVALALGTEAIQSGRAKNVLVLGIDKLSSLGSGALPLSPDDREVKQGIVMPAVYAMRAARYLHETGATLDDLAEVSVKARRNGANNPYAQKRASVTAEDVLASRPVADPLTLLMCCPRSDGAAAVVLSATPPGTAEAGVGLRAVSVRSGNYTDGYRDMTRSELSELAIQDAYGQAGFGPEDIQLAEVHDAFAISELMYYESLGFAPFGEGFKLIRDGRTDFGGTVVVNPSGGLISRGHPVGATGIAQICEAYWQVTGQAEGRQVEGARNAITHCTGGGIAGFDHGAAGVAIVSLA